MIPCDNEQAYGCKSLQNKKKMVRS